MKFWISKYALTQGVFEVEAEVSKNSEDMIFYYDNGHMVSYHGRNNEWHEIKGEAVQKAEKMRLKKIESHKKSIIKLEKMKFE